MKKGFFTGIVGIAGMVAGAVAMDKIKGNVVDAKDEKIAKFKGYYNILNQWLFLKQEGKSLEKYFLDNGYQTIAIYGMGELGNRLYKELKNTSIEVKYAVDQSMAGTCAEIEVIDKVDALEPVDVIVVTATFAFDEIEKELCDKVDCPIVSLEDVVYEV